MTTADTETREETQLVEAWRAEQLEMAGYGAQAAAEVAMRHDVDLHVAVELVGQGCPAELALKILL
jgi:ABC-type phosphate/phosphonate transport system substrate-binding protein